MHACMYACMYVFMYARMYVYMYICMYVCMHVCTYIYIHTYIYILYLTMNFPETLNRKSENESLNLFDQFPTVATSEVLR